MATDNTDEQVKQHYGFQSAQRAYCLSPEPDPLVENLRTLLQAEIDEYTKYAHLDIAELPDLVNQAQIISHLAQAIRALEGR